MTKQANEVREVTLMLQQIHVQRAGFALDIADIRFHKGEIVCLVGPNGCGKTTLLLAVLGLLPYDGICRVGPDVYNDSPAMKARFGYIPDDPTLLFEELTAAEQWSVTASVLAGILPDATEQALMARARELARTLSFDPPAKLARDYSHGMRKKVQIVNACMGSPDIIVVDELHNGLDPIAIVQAEGLLISECRRGATVLAATHDLWWAERLADRVIMLNQGRIIATGKVQSLLRGREKHLEEAFVRLVTETV
jgi:ABC-2 type transport system ATP-binding protein